MTPQPSRGGTPLYPTPPPISYPAQAAPSNYLTYPTGGMPQPQPNAYGTPSQAYAAPQPTVPTIPDALAAMPEEQRVSTLCQKLSSFQALIRLEGYDHECYFHDPGPNQSVTSGRAC